MTPAGYEKIFHVDDAKSIQMRKKDLFPSQRNSNYTYSLKICLPDIMGTFQIILHDCITATKTSIYISPNSDPPPPDLILDLQRLLGLCL